MARKRSKKTEAPEAQGGAVEQARGRFWRYCFVLVLAGAVALAWLSMLTFSPTDPPSPAAVAGGGVQNVAGSVGAFIAFHLIYWLGGGAYMGLLFASVAAMVMILGGRIGDVPWRFVGLVLLIVTTSTAIYLINPQSATDLYRGSAGVIGINAGHLLRGTFKIVGAWVIVGIAFSIGLMFTADHLVLQIPGIGRRLWKSGCEQIPSVIDTVRSAVGHSEDEAELPVGKSPAKAASAPLKTLKPVPGKSAGEKSPAEMPEAANEKPAAAVAAPAPRAEPPKPAAQPKPVVAKPATPAAATKKGDTKYELPSPDLLAPPSHGYTELQQESAAQRKVVLQQTLDDFGVAAQVIGYMTGPVITIYEISLAPGVKVAQVANLATDIARSLAVPGVRIVPPRFGKDTVGIEVPNLDKEVVRIRELMDLRPDAAGKMHLPLYLGKDAAGDAIVADLAAMPHMLIAGTTGSGKSVCINTIIMSLLLVHTPEEVRLILVDPKMVEMAAFEDIPHLLCPIVNDMRKAEDILEWAAKKMDERYEILKEAGVRNLAGYNRLDKKELFERLGITSEEEKARVPLRLPHFVIIIDELADLMMTSSKEVEAHIIRIAQKARAVGIHLVLATQRPSVNVVTGLIKSNMPCRISFRVASRQESRIVLDQNGADVLLGQGDMLFLQPGTSNLVRAQGTYIEDAEIRTVINELRKGAEPNYNPELVRMQSGPSGEGSGEKDELFDQGVEIVLASQRGSVSLLQRRLQVGYSRASRIIDQMAEAGLLGDYKGSQARECLLTLEDWHAMRQSIAADQSGASARDGTPTSA